MNIRKMLFLFAAMGLWIVSLMGAPSSAAIEMRWAESVIEHKSLQRALAQADPPVRAVLWGITTADERTVATYAGDPLLLVGDRMLTGSAGVCAVSRDTALSLWGSANVAGRTITLNGKDYAVSGVYPTGVADVLLPWDGVSDAKFNQMAVRFPGQPDGAQYGKALDFASAMGLSAPDDVLDMPLLCGAARAMAGLPGWILVLLAILWQWRMLRGMKWVRATVITLSLAGLVLVMGSNLIPPKWLLPSRWSDFAYWESLAGEIGSRLSGTLRAAHNPLNSQTFYACLRSTAMALAGAALLIDIRGGRDHVQDMGRAGVGCGAMLRRLRARARRRENRTHSVRGGSV